MRPALLFSLALVLAACSAESPAVTAPAQLSLAASVSHESFTQSLELNPFTIESACGEDIVVNSGYVHFTRRIVTNENGTLVKIHANLQNATGQGVTTGAEYRIASHTGVHQQFLVPLTSTFILNHATRAISRGALENVLIDNHLTVVIRDGIVERVHAEARQVCPG